MAQSRLHTAPNLQLKVAYEASEVEKLIGYASGLSFTVNNGQKEIYTVDSVAIQELAQGAAPTNVKGSLIVYLPKGSDPIRAGLVAPTFDIGTKDDTPVNVTSKYLHWKIYDRFTGELVFAINFAKVGVWNMSIGAKQVVKISLQFTGQVYETGVS